MADGFVAFMRRDWGQVLAAAIAVLVALAFITSPRTLATMVGTAVEAFSNNGYLSPDGRWTLIAGFVAGGIAWNWRIAAPLIIVGIAVVLIWGPHLSYDNNDKGLAIIGFGLFVAFSAAATRIVVTEMKPILAKIERR
jgi:hypothetical protein